MCHNSEKCTIGALGTQNGIVGQVGEVEGASVGFWAPGLADGDAQVCTHSANCTLRIESKLNIYALPQYKFQNPLIKLGA